MHRAALSAFLLFALALGTQPLAHGEEAALKFHAVPVPIRSYRLLEMTMDDEGFIWAGSIHRTVHRYDPRTGKLDSVKLPYDSVASSCRCVGKKVYIFGQDYPRLIIYDRASKKFSEVPYPAPKPNVWYATSALEDRYFYLFERNRAGVIKWDTEKETGAVIPFPYSVPVPVGGTYEPRDRAVWARVFELAYGKYNFLGMVRLDAASDKFTLWEPVPDANADLKPYTNPDTTLFVPITLKGKLLPYDFKEKRWCKPIDVPEFGKRFGFLGGPWQHKGRYYFSVSTYNGTKTGCDGKPYHFCNTILEFDLTKRAFHFYPFETKEGYYQISYMLSAGGGFYVTGTNIQEADGTLNGDRAGEVIVWQTRAPARQE